MTRISKNMIGASGILFISLICLLSAVQLPFGSLTEPGEGFMPVIVSVLLASVCILKMGKELIEPGSRSKNSMNSKTEVEPEERVNNKRPFQIIGAMIVYPFLLGNLGFIFATIVLLFVTLRLMEYRNWWISLLVALGTTFLVNFIFGDVFGISMPEGIFE